MPDSRTGYPAEDTMIGNSELGQLHGMPVIGSDGDRIGKVKDVYEDTDGSGGTFATVTTGLFGTGSSFVPLSAAELRGSELVVPFDKEKVKGAPRLEDDQELVPEEEQKLYAYYGLGGGTGAMTTGTADTTTATGAGHDTSGPNTDSAMTRSEEHLEVGTTRQEVGRARLRKYVVTETETRTVPVSHEEVRVEREPITDANVGAAYDGPAISEEEHEVVLVAEKPVVAKEAVPVERVRLDTETVTEQAQVTEDVRKERIDVEGADVYPEGSTTGTRQDDRV
jgi:uncharacterized protein (TIGR02271 family)